MQDLTPWPLRRSGEVDDQTHLDAWEAVAFEASLDAQDGVEAGEVEAGEASGCCLLVSY